MKGIFVKIASFARKHSSEILTIGGCIGVAATAITGIQAGLDLEYNLDKIEKNDRKSKRKVVAKSVAPVVISSVATMGCIVGLYKIDKKKEAALLATISMLNARFIEFKKHLPEETVEKVEKEIMMDELDGEPIFHTEVHEGKRILCWDSVTERYFTSSYEDLLNASYHINRHFITWDFITVNEYCKYLGIPEVEWGETNGWDTYVGATEYGYRWIDIKLNDEIFPSETRVMVVDVPFGPHYDFNRC